MRRSALRLPTKKVSIGSSICGLALIRHLHPPRFQHVQKRRHRADIVVHGDDQRRPARGRARRIDHGVGPGAGRGPAELPAAVHVRARSTLDAIPTTKRMGQYATIIPGATYSNATFQDVGGNQGEGGQFAVHGARAGDISQNFEGISSNQQAGGVYSFNSQTFQEVVVETGGTSAEAVTGGVQMNIIAKDGGNQLSGSFSTAYAGPSLQSDNLTQDLQDRGLKTASVDQAVLRSRRRAGRSDRPRQAVVLHRSPVVGRVAVHSGQLFQRVAGHVVLHARSQPSVAQQRVLPGQQPQVDVAGCREAQDRVLLFHSKQSAAVRSA